MMTKRRKQDKQNVTPARIVPPGSRSFRLALFPRVALAEYRHYVVRVKRDSPADRLDDDSGKRCRYRGLFLLYREIRLVPFFGQIRHRVHAPLLLSFMLAPFPLQFRFVRFHARQRRPVPFR